MASIPTEQEIEAYIDGQLDVEGRFAVEDYLGLHPDKAAQVMGDLGRRSALQLLSRGAERADRGAVCDAEGETAATGFWRRQRVAVAGFALAGLAALALAIVQGPPAYIDDALASHRVAAMRADMASQPEAPSFDAAEIRRATRIALPPLPTDWKVTDVQLFPTHRGPAIVMALQTKEGDQFSLFTKRGHNGAPEEPDAIRDGAHSVAYWRRGDMSFALVGDGGPAAVDARAEVLARTSS